MRESHPYRQSPFLLRGILLPWAVRPRNAQTEQVCSCEMLVYVFFPQRVRGAGDFPLAVLAATPGSICWGWLPKTRVAVGSLVLTIRGPTVRSLATKWSRDCAPAPRPRPHVSRSAAGSDEPVNSCPPDVCCVCFAAESEIGGGAARRWKCVR